MHAGQKLLLQFNKFGQTIGTHATKFSRTVDRTIRIELPPSTLHQVNVIENHKETMYQRIVVNQFILKCSFTSNYFIYAYISICKDLIGLNSHCQEKYKFEKTPKIKGWSMQLMGRKFSNYKGTLKPRYIKDCNTHEGMIKNFQKYQNDRMGAFC